jgi:hypothetical protein
MFSIHAYFLFRTRGRTKSYQCPFELEFGMQTSSKETFTLNSTMTDLLCSTLVYGYLYVYI